MSLEIDLQGPQGNVMSIIGIGRRVLREYGSVEEAEDFVHTAFECESYAAVLQIFEQRVGAYVPVKFVGGGGG